MTTSAVFTVLTEIMSTVWEVFGTAASTIMENKLLFVPVLIALGGSLIFFVISAIRRFGIRGVAASGGRRHR